MKHVTNHEYGQECEWCHGKIEVGEECLHACSNL